MINLAIATHIPMSEWRREIGDDERVLVTAAAILKRIEQATHGRDSERGARGTDDGRQYSG